MLWVFKHGYRKLIHPLSGLGTKLGLINSVFIFAKFFPVDKNNLVISKAEISFEEINGDLSGCFSGFVGFVNRVDQYLVSNQVVLSFKEQFSGLIAGD